MYVGVIHRGWVNGGCVHICKERGERKKRELLGAEVARASEGVYVRVNESEDGSMVAAYM